MAVEHGERADQLRTRRAHEYSYYLAHFAKSLLWVCSDTLTLYVLITIHEIRPADAGMIFFIASCWHACCDLIAGLWIDRLKLDGRQLAGLISLAMPVAAGAFVTSILIAPFGIELVLGAMLVFRTAYACYDVPHNAFISSLARKGCGPTRLAKGRTIGTALAMLAVSFAALPFLGATEDQYFFLVVFAVGVAVTATAGGLLFILPVRHQQGMILASPDSAIPVRSQSTLSFLLATMLGIVALGALAKGVLQLAPIGWSASSPDTGTALLLLTLGRLASALPFPRLPLERDHYASLAIAYVMAGIVGIATIAVRSEVTIFLFGFAAGMINLRSWSALAAFGHSATLFGLFTMLSKIALGASALLLTTFLGDRPALSPARFDLLALTVTLTALFSAALLLRSAGCWKSSH